jgi:hypothetical protein
VLLWRRGPIRVSLPLALSSFDVACSVPLVSGRFKISATVRADPQVQLSLRANDRLWAWSHLSATFSQFCFHAQHNHVSVDGITSFRFRDIAGPLAACVTLKGPEHTISVSIGFTELGLSDDGPEARERYHFSVRTARGSRFAAWYDSDKEGRGLRVMKGSLQLGTASLSAAAAWGREKKIWGEVTWASHSCWRMKASIRYSKQGMAFASTLMLQYDVRSEAERKKRKDMISWPLDSGSA